MAKTQLQPTGLPGKSYGSFSRTEAKASGQVTKLGVSATPSRLYGDLSKTQVPTSNPKAAGQRTRLGVQATAQVLYGDFGAKATPTASITGDVTLSTNVAATATFKPTDVLAADVTVSLTTAASALTFTSGETTYSFSTPFVTTSIIPEASALNFGGTFGTKTGDVTLSFTTQGTSSFVANYDVTGDLTLTTSVAATLVRTASYNVAGAQSVNTSVAATMAFTTVGVGASITGDVTLEFFPATTFLGDPETRGETGPKQRRPQSQPGRLGRR